MVAAIKYSDPHTIHTHVIMQTCIFQQICRYSRDCILKEIPTFTFTFNIKVKRDYDLSLCRYPMNELPHSSECKATAITTSSNTVYDMVKQGRRGGGGGGEGGASGVGGVPEDDHHYDLIGLSIKGPPPAKPLDDDEYEKMIRLQTLPAVPSSLARPACMLDIVNADGAGEKDKGNVYEHIPGDM